MKLSDWADKQGISYLTAYRWFKKGNLPVEAYQSDSGTIIVKDEFDVMESSMENNQQNDAVSLFFKKTLEYSKNASTIEDFASYIFSTFSLKLKLPTVETPKYSRQRPKSEEIQKHFQKFIPKGEKPKPNMFLANPDELDNLVAQANGLEVQELVNQIRVSDEGVPAISHAGVEVPVAEEMKDLLKELSTAVSSVGSSSFGIPEGVMGSQCIMTNSSSPHTLNYTSSNCALSSHGDLNFSIGSAVDNNLIGKSTTVFSANKFVSDPPVSLTNVTASVDAKAKRGRPRKK
jgi:hypothetical protein